MKRVDGLRGKNFLLSVLVLYFLVFFFSYFYFMTASTLIVGKAIVETEKENYKYMNDPALIQTLWVLLILFFLFIFVYLIPRIMHKRQMKNRKIKTENYKPFKSQ